MTVLDVERIRRETPGCAHVVHFNSAGASLMPGPVFDAVVQHLDLEARIGGYEAEAQASQAIEGAYRSVAHLLGCEPREVALVENATRAWDMAFYAYAASLKAGDRILTGTSEYASNYIAFLQVARRTGAVVEAVPDDEHGALSVDALRHAIDDRVKLIAITHVPTNGGLVNPAAEVGRVAREAGIPYLLDACQSVGQMPVDVREIGCDFLSATGRKFLRGPRGTGLLYVRREWIERLEPPFLDLHAATWTGPQRYEVRPDARRFENWESYVAGRVGLGAAVDYALSLGLPAIEARLKSLAARLRDRLAEMPWVTVRDLGAPGRRCGIVTFTCDRAEPVGLQGYLRAHAINVSTSRASSTLLDMRGRGLDAVVRASVHCFNTDDEIDLFCAAVRRFASERSRT